MGEGHIKVGDEVHQGAGRMPAPQRARRPRYIGSQRRAAQFTVRVNLKSCVRVEDVAAEVTVAPTSSV